MDQRGTIPRMEASKKGYCAKLNTYLDMTMTALFVQNHLEMIRLYIILGRLYCPFHSYVLIVKKAEATIFALETPEQDTKLGGIFRKFLKFIVKSSWQLYPSLRFSFELFSLDHVSDLTVNVHFNFIFYCNSVHLCTTLCS